MIELFKKINVFFAFRVGFCFLIVPAVGVGVSDRPLPNLSSRWRCLIGSCGSALADRLQLSALAVLAEPLTPSSGSVADTSAKGKRA